MTKAKDVSLPSERWLQVVGYEGWYDVSDHGRVRRMMPGKSTYVGKVLIAQINHTTGYPVIWLHVDGSTQMEKIHQLVAAAFIGNVPDGKEINHRDGVKTNNMVNNLEYITRSENILHAFRSGLKVPSRGERHGMSKLTWEDIATIRGLPESESRRSIARRYGVAHSTITRIINNIGWKEEYHGD